MDDLDRMFHRLVSVIRADFPSYLENPFEVAELYQSVIPYRHHRRELGFETNQDYELTLTRLLAGARGYLVGDPRMQERLRQELAGSNPDTSVFRGFATTTVRLDPESVRYIESPEAARGERRPPPAERQGGERFVDDHLMDDRGPRRPSGDDDSTSEAQTVVFRRANAPAPQTPQAPPPPTPAPAAAAAAPPSAAGAPPVTVTATGPTPSTQFTRAAAPRGGAPNAEAGSGGRSAPRPPAAAPPRPTSSNAGGAAAPASASSSLSTRQAMPTPQRGARTIVASGNCHYCSGELPEGRHITFCPHCGQNLTIQHCPACSTELELGWKFCTTCGRSVAEA